jgi:hypothetical protein
MIDLTVETPIPLAAAAAFVPPARGGRKTHLSTLLRWVLTGTRGPAGERIRLEAVRLGNRWMTSREAIQRFSDRLTPQLDTPPPPTPRTPARRRRDAERAGEKLDQAWGK